MFLQWQCFLMFTNGNMTICTHLKHEIDLAIILTPALKLHFLPYFQRSSMRNFRTDGYYIIFVNNRHFCMLQFVVNNVFMLSLFSTFLDQLQLLRTVAKFCAHVYIGQRSSMYSNTVQHKCSEFCSHECSSGRLSMKLQVKKTSNKPFEHTDSTWLYS